MKTAVSVTAATLKLFLFWNVALHYCTTTSTTSFVEATTASGAPPIANLNHAHGTSTNYQQFVVIKNDFKEDHK
jgi:hypothetical protein